MSNSYHLSFRTTVTRLEADEIASLLSENDIPSRVAKNEGDLDHVFNGESPTDKFEVLIHKEDLSRAENVLVGIATEQLNEISPDQYLYSFSNEDLLNVLIEKNEWNEIDVLLSERILKDRGVEIDYTELSQQRKQRMHSLSEPKGGQIGWVIIGYISAFLGGFLGLVIGYFIWQAKNKLPNGEKVPAYNERLRKHGLAIFLISLVVFPIVLFSKKLAFGII